MNLLIKKPYLTFWISIPITLLYGFLSSVEFLDINIHDTYFVFSLNDLAFLISIIFGIIGLIYWIMVKVNRNLFKLLNLIHIALTFGGILLVLILGQLFNDSLVEFEYNNKLNFTISIILLVIIFGQTIFLINIFSGLIRMRNKTNG